MFKVQDVTVAILLCECAGRNLGLLLHPSPDNLEDPKRPRFRVGYGFRRRDGPDMFARLVRLGGTLASPTFLGQPVAPRWRTLHIVDVPPLPMRAVHDPLRMCDALLRLGPPPPFRVPNWLHGHLAARGWKLEDVDCSSPGLFILYFVDSEPPPARAGFWVMLGTCDSSMDVDSDGPGAAQRRPQRPVHWAHVVSSDPNTPDSGPSAPFYEPRDGEWSWHSCVEHHVRNHWPGMARNFPLAATGARTGSVVRLSFTRSLAVPEVADATLELHIDLLGSVN